MDAHAAHDGQIDAAALAAGWRRDGVSLAEITRLLRGMGHVPCEVVGALRSAGVTLPDVAQALRVGLWHSQTDVARVLLDSGASLRETVQALRLGLDVHVSDVLRILWWQPADCRPALADVVRVLMDVTQLPLVRMELFLLHGLPVEAAAQAMRDVFGYSPEQVTRAIRYRLRHAQDVAFALMCHHGLGLPESVARGLLLDAGYAPAVVSAAILDARQQLQEQPPLQLVAHLDEQAIALLKDAG